MNKQLLFLMGLLFTSQVKAQIIITGFHNDPKGANTGLPGTNLSTVSGSAVHYGGFEYIQLKATRDVDFSQTPYAVLTNINAGVAQAITAELVNGWATGGARTYQFSLTSGAVRKGEFFYVGGPEMRINGAVSGVKSTDISGDKGNPYVGFPETFESVSGASGVFGATGTAYIATPYNVDFPSGNWGSALSGFRNESTDRKMGSIAWRSGGKNTAPIYLTMNFNVPNGASKVSITYGVFASDLTPSWSLEYSTDGGNNWLRTGDIINEKPSYVDAGTTKYDRARTIEFKMNINGPVRFRVKKEISPADAVYASGQQDRLNIDNFMIHDNLPKTTNVGKWIRIKNYYNEAGDNGVGNADRASALLSPSGNVSGIGVFTGTNVTSSSIPVDAIFFNNNNTLPGAKIFDNDLGMYGLKVPNNDLYNSQYFMGQGGNDISKVLAPNISGTDVGGFCKLGGVFDLETNTWTTVRSANYVVLSQNSQLAEIESNAVTVLPVRYASFSGKLINDGVNLSWATIEEKNNSYFNILRSSDGRNFEEIGKVSAAGYANTYKYLDRNAVVGFNYYRLEQVDLNGEKTTSKTIFVNTNFSQSQFSVSVNSNLPAITLHIYSLKADKVNLTLTNTSGQKIGQQGFALLKGYNVLQVPVFLVNGVYVASLYTSTGVITAKFTK